MTQKRIRIDDIRIDGSTQMRESIDADDVKELAEHYKAGGETPVPKLFWDGTSYWPGDGHHRIAAHRAAGHDAVIVEVEPGSKRDAILYAAGANWEHGVKRTNGDKRKAVATLLKDKEWSLWSDRFIAATCHVSHVFVGAIRAQLSTGNSSSALENQPNNQAQTRIASDGRTMPASQPPKPEPRCDRCTRIYRSDPLKTAPDCEQCANLRARTKSKPAPTRPSRAANPPSPASPREEQASTKVCPTCKGTGQVAETSKAFKKPTVEEVRAYCQERKNTVDADEFMDHYTANGWKVGKAAMKDWRAAVRTWEKSRLNGNGKPKLHVGLQEFVNGESA